MSDIESLERLCESIHTVVNPTTFVKEVHALSHLDITLKVINVDMFGSDMAAESIVSILKTVIGKLKLGAVAGKAGGAAAFVGKTVATSVSNSTVLVGMTVASANADKVSGYLKDISILRNPLMYGKIVNIEMDKLPLDGVELTLPVLQKLIDMHMSLLDAVASILRTGSYTVSTIPDIDVSNWLRPVAALGGPSIPDTISTPPLYGNAAITTFKNEDKWETKVASIVIDHPPKAFKVPKPMDLIHMLTKIKAHLGTASALEGELAKLSSDIIVALDKHKGRGTVQQVTFIQQTIKAYYTVGVGKSIELLIQSIKFIEHITDLYRKAESDFTTSETPK